MAGVGLDVPVEDGQDKGRHDKSACQYKDPHGLAHVALDAAIDEVAVAYTLIVVEIAAYDGGSQVDECAACVHHD